MRGGVRRDPHELLEALQEYVAAGLTPSLCVSAGDAVASESHQELFRRLCLDGQIRHGQVMTSTVGALAAAGFEILDVRTGREPYCHYEYQFGGLLAQDDLGRWISCFADPVRNPAKENS